MQPDRRSATFERASSIEDSSNSRFRKVVTHLQTVSQLRLKKSTWPSLRLLPISKQLRDEEKLDPS
jgi:hypothetical protein